MNKVIYEPSGKAKEYSDFAVNLFTGCSHGCTYCYAPNVLHRKPEDFHANVQPRPGILDKLRKEAPAHKGKEVLLCFTCDPYCPEERKFGVTREAITILQAAGVGVNILTKSGDLPSRDFDLLHLCPDLSRIGATLTFSDAINSLEFEPKASLPDDRIAMLNEAHDIGLPTWASLEPVIDPEQTLNLINLTHSFVDYYKIGKWNYDKRANDIDWADFLRRAVKLLDSLGAEYYIKKDLAAFSERGME